jgi:hypothetical protein
MKLLEMFNHGPQPKNFGGKVNYMRDSILFLQKINQRKHNPVITRIINDMRADLNNLVNKRS